SLLWGLQMKSPEQNGDDENLMSVPSEKETQSYSVTSFGTDLPANSCQNGTLTNGDVLSGDSATTDVQPSGDELPPDVANQQDASSRSSKCPQTRELPQIPGNGSVQNTESTQTPKGETTRGACETYEVLKDSTSQDNIIEDSLYETVKELKGERGTVEESACVAPEINSQSANASAVVLTQDQNAELADGTQTVEYATVDKQNKNRQSSSAERVLNSQQQAEEDPPPLPTKDLGENDCTNNDQERADAEIAAMYSTVSKPVQSWNQADGDQEGGYASIDEMRSRRPTSTSSDLYASVADFERESGAADRNEAVDVMKEETDPGYEAVGKLKADMPEQDKPAEEQSTGRVQGENDYESISELQQRQNADKSDKSED
uniref:Phosphoprotein membrane anchor with glycosphingolipid microdomains 1 n=1 Tax=Callorhinchus milii TaxID=7868 RepID=A0A4W3GHL0_CALMI